MRIGLVGYGKMGKAIEKIAIERGHDITAIIDIANIDELKDLSPEKVDVVIEFSHPDVAFDNIMALLGNKIPVVSGTTGWLTNKSQVENFTKETDGTFFYASNYSIGVNLFFKLNKLLAGLMKGQNEYSLFTNEIHHTTKKDSPSGTAITLAEGIIENNPQYKTWINNEIPSNEQIAIWSQREGAVAGTHLIKYISNVDEIEIKHHAFSREGFALGAVVVAEWVKDKKGILGMEDMLQL
ncbi:MAG: 4-hydroxy-tetrahydrodipicolinate reductase [Bacteroidota bacterium]|jgi:4-hydroxy-tetrahydrodipicolinate reductase